MRRADRLVSACASTHELAKCDGPIEALNASHWQPTPVELAAMERLK